MKTVHVILNAHLDPIWLWSWRDGLDEVLNTSYYICNLLDRNPDIIYTRGEAWLYEQIKRIDPPLFARVQAHVKAGRWEVVGGWYIQPDCNLPSGFAMEQQIALGKDFFTREFGQFPGVAYNVDSFGHAATFPGYMRGAGQSSYVMMRPQEHEMELPARVFRWRGYADGPEVTTFRIAKAYCTPDGMNEEHLRAALSELPDGVKHTMCYVGIGDHGGGPTESMIEWCRQHRDSFPGVRIEFSSPSRFFAAIEKEKAHLPLVVGELQMHAVGCYTVVRDVKTLLRRAEHRLVQAKQVLQGIKSQAFDETDLKEAWKKVCFHHFHDTLGGTCLPSAYPDVYAQLGQALAIADEAATYGLRQRLPALGEDSAQRLVFFNASESTFSDYVEIEPWIEWSNWQPSWKLLDADGKPVAYQTMAPETASDNQVRLLFHLTLGPNEMKVLRIVAPKEEAPAELAGSVRATATALVRDDGLAVNLAAPGFLAFPGATDFLLPDLSLLFDPTDTWSHGIVRYDRTAAEVPKWEAPIVMDKGPLMASLIQKGTIGVSSVQAEWRLQAGKPWVDCLLRVVWNERNRLLKLDWNLPAAIAEREDGIMGGSLIRPADGKELPFRDWVRLRLDTDGNALQAAMISPDVFALDGGPACVGLTLLRSSVMACHEPNPGTDPRGVVSDRGEHFFRFRFVVGSTLSAAELDVIALGLHRPPLSAEVTRGMKTRGLRGGFGPTAD